jgi:hypothetical protein
MIKKIALFSMLLLLFSCTTAKLPLESKPLYDVLIGSDYGGASFQFYEIISTEDEFNILLSDEIIKPYVKKEDIINSNFILVNMGEKKSVGYSLKVQKVEELPDKIVVTLKEIEPKRILATEVTKPCYVIRIKSKKPIEIK